MRRRIALGGAAIAILAVGALGGALGDRFARGSTSESASFQPACPHASYGASGGMAPLFCKIANPVAVDWYRKDYPTVFALGPNATPAEVTDTIADICRSNATQPTLTDAYRLQSFIQGWQFAFDPVAGGLPCP